MSKPYGQFDCALNFAEGWLSGDHGGRLRAGYAGARYAGYRGLSRILVAFDVARSLCERGLERGFDLHLLKDQETIDD